MTGTPPTFESVRAALECIPPDIGHDDRVRLAFAVFDGLGDAGADLWLEWAGSRSKPSAAEDRATWKSARKRGAVTVATLFGIAKDYGYRHDAGAARPAAPTADELKARAAERQAAEARERAELQQRQRQAAEDAARLWSSASESGASAYLERKGVQSHGGRFGPGGVFLVPARDAAGELWNVQSIRPQRPADGGPDKLFVKGARKAGTFHLMGSPEGVAWILVAEGYATAASVHEATGRPVAVAWDAGNLAHVVRALRGRYPSARLAVCGDDDRPTEGRTGRNPGRLKATAAARLAKGPAVFPAELPDGGTDFNDMHQAAGLAEVGRLIEAALGASERGAPSPDADRAEKTAPAGRRGPARGDAAGSEGASAGADRFRVDDDALWFDPPDDGSGSAARPVRVCGPLAVVALARDAHDTGAALLLEFDTPFRKGRRWLMPLVMLAGDGTAYRAELLNQGFMVPTDAKRRALLTAYLQSRRPAELVRIVDRVGWHGRAYVLPRETLGDEGGERIMFQSDGPVETTFGQRGTLEQWRERIGALCVGNSRLMFAASCAFAGPLLAWASGTDGGGFHLVGDSSCGKTTALRVAASVWGGRDYMQRWRATDNGLEGMAAQHSDGLLCLDELAQLDAKVAGESAYMLANGQGKSRAGRTGAARPRLTWRLQFLSAGEVGLAEHMAEANKRTRAGQELRMNDLPADAGCGRGIFEDLHGHESGGALSQHLTRAAETTFGTAGRAWLVHLSDSTEGLSRLVRQRIETAEAAIVPEIASGQVQRVGRRFALLAVAGELATEAGITGWPAGAALQAVKRCFDAWTAARPGGVGLSEDVQILRQVRGWFATFGEMNFKRWGVTDSDHAPAVPMMAGWRKPIMGDERNAEGSLIEIEVGRVWFVLADRFRADVCKGFPPGRVLQVLKARDLLVLEPSGEARHKARPPGEAKDGAWVYRVRSAILSAPDE